MPRQTKRQLIAEIADQLQEDGDWYDNHPDSSSGRNSLTADGTNVSNLYPLIDRENVHGFNLTIPQLAGTVIKPWNDREDTTIYADSQASVTKQMIVHVPFSQKVRIKSILLKLGKGSAMPRRLKVYANCPNIMDFNNAECIKPHLTSLLQTKTTTVEYPVKAAAFNSVHSLDLHFCDAVGISRIYYIGFKGDATPLKEGTNQLEVPAVKAAHAPVMDHLVQQKCSILSSDVPMPTS
ncbi:hypothetical protein AZE42_01001 [Rhizopogon vesiculosus]|uniref:PITH domain-containing protein n=1 Tax=Rhizopogon vesiculosus TaxID=180088 RepID=A0A1J8QG34_9AGAM|nr:hypothetical protein AZE42_01001 [Rhizopogon vesiculosus]